MSSKVLYPPIVDSYMPAFKADNDSVEIFFRLSKFNTGNDFKSVHISITKQGSGANIVNVGKSDDGRYRATGIILNAAKSVVQDSDGLYSVTISRNDLKGGNWNIGWVYKVQIRLSGVSITNSSVNQAQWLNENANEFSEWSTVCTLKAIGTINYVLQCGQDQIYNTQAKSSLSNELRISTLDITGRFIINGDIGDKIHSYQFLLYDELNNLLEDSGSIYLNENQIDNLTFRYVFKTELEDKKTYFLSFNFITNNKYTEGLEKYSFYCEQEYFGETPCRLIALENDIYGLLSEFSSIDMEEDEGRIGLKFYRPEDHVYNGNLCIRRSDSRTNFKVWEDIYICGVVNKNINDIPVFYDYTIESGVYYKYGVQQIDVDGARSKLDVMSYPIMRNFNYSFLLGKNNKQLKLMFDNTMTNFKYQVMDSKNDTIGNKYTNITRNAATYYRTFPVNGLISFWMDENNLFCNKKDIYKYEDIIDLYESYDTRKNISQYNYIYERDFREKVLEFLQDGELKLFKSPTEGNIIVRLMDVNCVPNQPLDRMIFSFSSTAYEMDDNNLANYLKYGFYKLDDLITDFSVYETRLGQLQMDFEETDDIIDEIKKKYNTQGLVKDVKGIVTEVQKIQYLRITFDEKPLKVKNGQGYTVLGNNIKIGRNNIENIITVYDPIRIYEFDKRLEFSPNDHLYLLSYDDETVDSGISKPPVHATVDFVYQVSIGPQEGKKIQTRHLYAYLGQLFGSYKAQTNLTREIYYDWYWETAGNFSRLQNLDFIELEANPGTAFHIQDKNDEILETHVIGATGILRLYHIEDIKSLEYIGVQNSQTGMIEQVKSDLMVTYGCKVVKGTYVTDEPKEEENG